MERRLGATWAHLHSARDSAEATKEQLRIALKQFDSSDTVIVVSGSLARDEFTPGSDIDWTLLIDGFADARHYDLTLKIGMVVERIAAKPKGAEGTFSAMVFSHNLIHEIGGEDDTNRNTTRPLLLLLESAAVGREDAYQRVVRNILNRYLLEDRGFWQGSQFRVPRFLQNDFARYWRTMAVDFAYKVRKRSGKGWAIRNIKLRMSRKLIYVSGLLACYECHMDHTSEDWRKIAGSPDRQEQVLNYFGGVFKQTPLEIIAGMLLRFPHLDDAANQIIGSYNDFLGILADKDKRAHLESLPEDKGEQDEVYQTARHLSHTFRDGLVELFFDKKSGMETLTKNYGVF
ncbi:MAG: nucleotidyltransferase domain-containing protein [Bryobacteraceae bacterium]